jgi:acyl carrier protein
MLKPACPYVLMLIALLTIFGCSSPPAAPAPPKTGSPEHEEIVRAVIAELMNVDLASIDMNQPLSAPPLKADELDLVEMVMELEDRLGIVIPDADLEQAAGTLGKGPVQLTPAQLVTIVGNARERPRLNKK